MRTLAWLSVAFVIASLFESRGLPDDGIIFIVNAKNNSAQLRADQVVDLFLKRQREWGDGTGVRFIDEPDDSAARAYFLSHILRKSAQDIDLYWIGQKLYSGDSAPIQATSENVAISLVSRFAGGISYLSSVYSGTLVNSADVKPISVTGVR